ncbi:MAG: glycosyltransferase [Candidatus Hadarchaeum sp.]
MTRVLLIANCQSYQVGNFFARALYNLGIAYDDVDEGRLVEAYLRSLVCKLLYKVLKRPISYRWFQSRIIDAARSFRPSMVLVTKGAWIAPDTLCEVKALTGATLVNYATDDPFNPKTTTRDLIAGIPLYDLYVCTKRAITEDVRRAGCRNVVYVPFGYEPSLHFPELPTTEKECLRFASDLCFIGGADRDRFPVLRRVAELPGINLHLYGGYWQRDPMLRPFHRGFAYGRDYRLAMSGTRIALCLVRRANRDGHVMRTFEIPACSAFMLAERTEEHLSFFEEDKEMVCFGSDDELVDKVRYYLAHDEERQQIAQAGHRRVWAERYTYRDRLQEILAHVEGLCQ